ncbi:PepSY domain-containing protein [uncultured Polaribacter sp.]|uniref:PepSY domain-containing protein n=1 Tax=uncultured Polaribacter sp. TaxID=174711 RepID=UPI00261F06A1|nr:PepSY domain-containing protein [uncultured Polaribacter sp.]
MTISIWRYSHLTLAISSALFIIIASLTGIILAFEPISNQLKSNTFNLEEVTIAQTLVPLKEKYEEVIKVEIDANKNVIADVITKDGNSEQFYINPFTGKKVGDILTKKPIFEFATNLHRSLFLKSTGRFLVGFFSLLLFLITITGTTLIAKRQGGFTKIFSKIVKENFNQYYHIVLGRWFLIPIIIITLTGVYLSLERFAVLPKEQAKHQKINSSEKKEKKPITDFVIFKNTTLHQINYIEFPFSTDEEDYFFVKFDDKEIAINQHTGQLVSEKKMGLLSLFSSYSFSLHTGQGNIIWSLVLLISCLAILFFIYSGFYMTLKRRKNTDHFKNLFTKDEAEFIVLVGSETGSTNQFAIAFTRALLKINKKVFMADLNSYSTYKKATSLLVFTATYGDGVAPANANKFIKKLQEIKPVNPLKFAVVGFGSTNYPEFCKFAILVQANLQLVTQFIAMLPLYKINNQSYAEFNAWVLKWSAIYKLALEVPEKNTTITTEKKVVFKVISKSKINEDDTFLMELKPTEKVKFSSGDLLGLVPQNETNKRFYSIAKVNKHILLSIKKHQFGVCSSYLSSLNKGDEVLAAVQVNKEFHFPKKAKEVILIANGTGIAPFLGMINENKKTKIHLFWGGRAKKSFEIYKNSIETAIKKEQLTSLYSAYSREEEATVYVQDVLKTQKSFIIKALQQKSSILICGSLAMQKGVFEVLREMIKENLNTDLDKFLENGQIKTDCY